MTLPLVIDSLRGSLNELPPAQLTVAYSGGLDSSVLLALMQEMCSQVPKHSLQAVHVHHGLSPNADSWASHCERTCDALQIDLIVERVSVAEQSRTSLEASAREARYQALYRHAADGILLTGQHRDDQLETLLLQLKRGAGPGGLAGMADKQTGGENSILWRPFLDVDRDALLDYAKSHSLTWIEDESNADTRFDRNFLRQEILPALTQRWPGLTAAAARSARLCGEQQALLDEVAAEKLTHILLDNGSLDTAGLSALSDAWQRQVVRFWLKQQGVQMPTEAQLGQLKGLLLAKDDAQPQLNWGDWRLRRFQSALYLVNADKLETPEDRVWQDAEPLALPHLGLVLHRKNSNDSTLLHIRFGQFSERFTPADKPHSKPLKQWFKAWQIPPWERHHIAQVYQGEALLALVTPSGLVPGKALASEQLIVQ